METDRKEYLQRPLIEDVVYEITDNLIRVSNSNTLFINLTKRNRIQLAEVEKLFRELRKIAKNNPKLKLKGVTKFLPTIRELYPEYCEGASLIEKNFSEISKLFRQIKIDGLHRGYRDDELMNLSDAESVDDYQSAIYHSKRCNHSFGKSLRMCKFVIFNTLFALYLHFGM